jgi:outer membrane protein TolC
MKGVILCLLIGLLSGFASKAQHTSNEVLSLSLEDCIELVFKNNYNRQSIALNESASQEIYNQLKAERLPNLNASIGETYTPFQ